MNVLPEFIDDWFASQRISDMDLEEEGAYHRLLLHAAKLEDEGLPNDERVLANWSRLGAQWNRPTRNKLFRSNLTSGQKILACFEERDGRLFNLKVDKCVEEFKRRQSHAVKAAGHRWGNARALHEHPPGNATRVGSGSGSGNVIQFQTQTKASEIPEEECEGKPTDIAEFDAAQAFERLWDEYPKAGRVRKELARGVFFDRLQLEADRSKRSYEQIFAEMLAGLDRWRVSAQWKRGAVNNIANFFGEWLWKEEPLSVVEADASRGKDGGDRFADLRT